MRAVEIGSWEEMESAGGGSRSSIVAWVLVSTMVSLGSVERTPRYLSAQAAVGAEFVSVVGCFSRVKASLPVWYDAILEMAGVGEGQWVVGCRLVVERSSMAKVGAGMNKRDQLYIIIS